MQSCRIFYQLLEHKVKWSDWINHGPNTLGCFHERGFNTELTCSAFVWLYCAGFVLQGSLIIQCVCVCVYVLPEKHMKKTWLKKKHQNVWSTRSRVFSDTPEEGDVPPDSRALRDPKIQARRGRTLSSPWKRKSRTTREHVLCKSSVCQLFAVAVIRSCGSVNAHHQPLQAEHCALLWVHLPDPQARPPHTRCASRR